MSRTTEALSNLESATGGTPALVDTEKMKDDGYDGTCLRPTGMCELGGSCDICWYSPDHPRFKSPQE